MDCENCRHLTVVGLHDTGPRSCLFLGRGALRRERLSEEGQTRSHITDHLTDRDVKRRNGRRINQINTDIVLEGNVGVVFGRLVGWLVFGSLFCFTFCCFSSLFVCLFSRLFMDGCCCCCCCCCCFGGRGEDRGCLTSRQQSKCISGTDLFRQLYALSQAAVADQTYFPTQSQ